eukprot:1811888-Pyramimonas_sp.AAC.1
MIGDESCPICHQAFRTPNINIVKILSCKSLGPSTSVKVHALHGEHRLVKGERVAQDDWATQTLRFDTNEAKCYGTVTMDAT